MKDMTAAEKIEKALLKRAVGYSTTEVTEEFTLTDTGESVLTKKKISKKNIPPDISAAKLLLSTIKNTDDRLPLMTDEQLREEKRKLIELLKEEKKNEN